MSRTGYFRWPTVHGDRVVFVSEDDLWEVPLGGGAARRLTSGLGEARYPTFSPDGEKIAFVGTEEGATEIFVMDAAGGPGRQLTFQATLCAVVGWTADGQRIRFRSNAGQFSPRNHTIFEISTDGGQPVDLQLGKAYWYDERDGAAVIGRNADDLARWKRYRGGTAGKLWIRDDGEWSPLLGELESGQVRPMFIDGRVYFMSDEEGYGNLYSCAMDGTGMRRHTDHVGFYVRFAQTDGNTIVYTVGGELWAFDVSSGEASAIEVDYASPKTQLNRKFVDADEYTDDWGVHPKGHSLAVTTRGKLFNFGNWEGAVRQTGELQGVRYRLPVYSKDGTEIYVTSDATGEEKLEVHTVDGSEDPRELCDMPGRPVQMQLSPDGKQLAVANAAHEFHVIDVETGESQAVFEEKASLPIAGFDWSPDSRWLAYGMRDSWKTSRICILDTADWSLHDVTEGGFRDEEPCFDPDGRYLYFVSARWFAPVYDSLFFELSFPVSAKPCVITLQEDLDSLFLEKPRPLNGDDDDDDEDSDDEESSDSEKGDEKADKSSDDDEKDDDKKDDDKKDEKDEEPDPVEIDFDGIEQRIESFPVPVGHYANLAATSEKLLWVRWPADPSDRKSRGKLEFFDLEKKKKSIFCGGVDGFDLSADESTLVYAGREGLRVVSASSDSPPDDGDVPSRKTGWIDLERIPVSVEPRAEWRQMLRESWRLMRDQYWSDDFSGVDWDAIWERYVPLVERVASRSEFSDLVWVMQGEMGTSHAYEFGGDYREPPRYRPGLLGADFSWDEEAGGYRVEHIVRGLSWLSGHSSPLTAPGVNITEGDVVVAINGRRVNAKTSVNEALVHRAGEEVDLTVKNGDGETNVRTVKTLHGEFSARYREWVRTNRERVRAASDGKLGYVHIPDMSAHGFAEFHRGFLSEMRRDGLVVDVRNNGGGHVSQLILEKLARKRLGFDIGRHTDPLPYPEESIAGPIVAVTDENAGSDGDIFSHCFKLMKLGPLVGTRTWGGVVGIWPRHGLVDNSITTQPEFAFWFHDVGFGVENYGTDPDIVVELPPEASARGEDPQLDKAIELAMADLKENPVELPTFGRSPNIMPPPDGLPPRDEG